ncbi:MAG: GTP-binding protein [Candidatus Hodarchaeales archaeon]
MTLATENQDYQHYYDSPKIKLAILGNGKVGKTSLCESLREGRIPGTYDLTIGVDITTKDLTVAGNNIRLILWDMAGQNQFDCVRPAFYEGARAAMIVFSLQDRGSFYDVKSWIRELQNHSSGIPFVLVGNKNDLKKREVTKEEVEALAAQFRVPYVETSAKKSLNVEEAFRVTTILALQGAAVAW